MTSGMEIDKRVCRGFVTALKYQPGTGWFILVSVKDSGGTVTVSLLLVEITLLCVSIYCVMTLSLLIKKIVDLSCLPRCALMMIPERDASFPLWKQL